jgi:hypothetical protein
MSIGEDETVEADEAMVKLHLSWVPRRSFPTLCAQAETERALGGKAHMESRH